ncbi:MAG: hypothetical protein AAFQ80_02885 [Cyanobacteria bacterium J06621_8]
MSNDIDISLTHDEALVLFEMMSRFSDTDKLSIEHQSEKRALWNLCCLLEEKMLEPFTENYEELLNEARERLKD